MDRELNKIRPQLKKISSEHIMEDKIKKMRVKYATQVLSGTVASCIETLTRSKCKYSYFRQLMKLILNTYITNLFI